MKIRAVCLMSVLILLKGVCGSAQEAQNIKTKPDSTNNPVEHSLKAWYALSAENRAKMLAISGETSATFPPADGVTPVMSYAGKRLNMVGACEYVGLTFNPPDKARKDTVVQPAQPHSLNRRMPGLPYIAHWGWHAVINYQRRNNEWVSVDYFRERLIDEPFRWGANLIEFYPTIIYPKSGYPFLWSKDTPVQPIGRYPYIANPLWNVENARKVFSMAHGRDMIAHSFYHPFPVASGVTSEVNFLEFQAQEFLNVLLFGREACMDGWGQENTGVDHNSEGIGKVWQYNPGSYRSITGVHWPSPNPYLIYCFGGGLGWQIHCRQNSASAKAIGRRAWYGGGVFEDSVLASVNEFSRNRLYLDSAMWWLGEPEQTLPEAGRKYVYGISMDPIRCAFAGRALASGTNGYCARFGMTAESGDEWYSGKKPGSILTPIRTPFGCDSGMLQNNYMRLIRLADENRGALYYDSTRLAVFNNKICDNFLSARPICGLDISSNITVLSIGKPDGSDAEFKRAGGYQEHYQAGSEKASDFPGALGYENWPEWPNRVDISFEAGPGRYELVIDTLPVDTQAKIYVKLDGEVSGFYGLTPTSSPQHVVSFSLTESGRHVIELDAQVCVPIGSDGNYVTKADYSGIAHKFDAVSLRRVGDIAATFEYPAAAGHLAEMKETVVYDPKGEYRQARTWRIMNDSPVLRVDIASRAPSATAWELALDLPEYGELNKVAENIWRLEPKAKDCKHPALGIFVLGGPVEKVERRGAQVVLTLDKKTESTTRLGFLVDDGLYAAKDWPILAKTVFDDIESVKLSNGAYEYRNESSIPRVEVVKIENPDGGPYQVCEANKQGERFWLVRGAQPVGNIDYLKLYFQANGSAKIQSYGFIDSIVKAGYGCQYMLGIKDNIKSGYCEVEVVKTGPFVFAPRIEWKEPFDTVSVNGKPWRYFDGSIVYLPNRPGPYTVEVKKTGLKAPTIGRTCLTLTRCEWNDDEKILTIEGRDPYWWKGPLPGNVGYMAQILSKDYEPISVEGGGEIVPWSAYRIAPEKLDKMKSNGTTVRLFPGDAKIKFKKK